ncbi:endonuclease/exonuclease/phosphatase family protein [Gilvimarinus polysaccharolyticus]|uniref:endonuclease/exonuclease/phosphatase family protein n=1 Tax=Gilvimarinus polysaccharolyticus TaxID=863921 RepID=UPI0006734879|nr:endonuclease/exonuclease/phosphatase family protein [Gilvimarinus polysaccharolyticus]
MALCILPVTVLSGTAQSVNDVSLPEPKATLNDVEKALTGSAKSADQCQAKLRRSRAKTYGLEYQLPNVFSILSWNIYKAQNKNLLEDLTALSHKVDIVLLQEAFKDKNLESLKPYWRFSPGYRSDNMQSGVMTLSHWPASVHCQFSHQEPWLNTPKATNVVEYVLQNGERLLAINLHAINFTWGTKAYHAQLNTAAAIMRAHRGPIIFAGDLNSWSYSRRKVLTDVLTPLGLVATEFPVDNRTLTFGLALDYVWSRGVTINAAEVPIYESSDHNPLLVTVKIIKSKKASYVAQE